MTLSLRILLFDGDGDSRCGAQYVATNHQRHPWLPYDADVDVDVGQNLAQRSRRNSCGDGQVQGKRRVAHIYHGSNFFTFSNTYV